MRFPPIFLTAEIYDAVNINTFMRAVEKKEAAESKHYMRLRKHNVIEALGIDLDPEA